MYPGYFVSEWVGRKLLISDPFITVLLFAGPVAILCGLADGDPMASMLAAVATGRGGWEGVYYGWIPGPSDPVFVMALVTTPLSYVFRVFTRRAVRSRYQG